MLNHLSWSAMKQYLDCGLQFRFKKIDKLEPEHTSEALIFGASVHQALSKLNQQRSKGASLNSAELGDCFEEAWTARVNETANILYVNGNDFKKCLNQGRELLKVFLEQHQDAFQVLDVEKKFTLYLEGLPCPVIGYLDLVEEDENQNIIITEYKTSGKAYSAQQIDQNDQVSLYHLALQSLFPEPQLLNKIDCLIKTKIPRVQQYYTYRDQDDHARLIKIIRAVSKGIESEVYLPNTSSWKCGYCEFKTACHEWLIS